MSTTTEMPGSAPEALDEGLQLVIPGKSVPAGHGWDWIAGGWKLFARSPLMWIISIVALFVIMIVANLVPIVGGLAFQVLLPVFGGGYVAACRAIERGGEFEIEHLFAGFSKRFVNLLLVGVLYLVASLVILLVYAMFVGFSLLGAFLTGDANAMANAVTASIGALILGTLVAMALMVPVLAAFWFAPALVMMHDVPPIAALKASLGACFRNFVPFLIYGLVMFVFGIIAAIPFGLGLLVYVPLTIASAYAGYRDIFTQDEVVTAPARSPMV